MFEYTFEYLPMDGRKTCYTERERLLAKQPGDVHRDFIRLFFLIIIRQTDFFGLVVCFYPLFRLVGSNLPLNMLLCCLLEEIRNGQLVNGFVRQ